MHPEILTPLRRLGQSKFRQLLFVCKSTMPSVQELSDIDKMREIQCKDLPFARAKIGTYFQDQPKLHNTYEQDVTLQSYLKRVIPKKYFDDIEPGLQHFGERVATDIHQLALECEQNPPTLKQYDAWGRRVDEIVTCPAWKQMHAISAKEGLIATAYERKQGEYSRLHQVAKLYLYASSSGLFWCPLAMTDGASKLIEILLSQKVHNMDFLVEAYNHLTSRKPEEFWTSGQWMTERAGGSDIARGTETVAVLQSNGSYKLYGHKFFISATDSNIAFTLARVIDEVGKVIEGTKGLSMFYLKVRDDAGHLNNIEVQRLKDKLGTRQVPTAELLLDGTVAFRVSALGRGVASIANMLTLSRLHNTVASAGAMRRILCFARDYSTKRKAFGRTIKDYPLHVQTLARMEVECRGATLLILEVARLLGLDDTNKATEQDRELLRLLSPISKLYTGKQAMRVVSEGLESIGGVGYMEDSGLPQILRDAQVLTIWEGTTNILSLDVLRAVGKTGGGVLRTLHADIQCKLKAGEKRPELSEVCSKISTVAAEILQFAASTDSRTLEIAARDFAYGIARTYIGALLVEHAGWENASPSDILTAQRWCEKDLSPFLLQNASNNYSQSSCDSNYELVFDGYLEKCQL